MSWLFGSKKKTPVQSPVAKPTDNVEAIKDDDDFIVVEDVNKPANVVDDPPPLYPLIPGASPSSNSKTLPTQPSSLIHGIPFRLSKDAGILMSNENAHSYIVQRAQSAINNLDHAAFIYDFAVERSVIKETQ